jgi:hypothetical protein
MRSTIIETPSRSSLFLSSDPTIDSITKSELVEFFAWLQNDYGREPEAVAPRGKFQLSQKSILNIHVNLSSLWHWALEEKLVKTNVPPENYETICARH